MLVSLHPRFAAHRFAGRAITAGGLLFSSSIFLLVLTGDRCVLVYLLCRGFVDGMRHKLQVGGPRYAAWGNDHDCRVGGRVSGRCPTVWTDRAAAAAT